MDEEGVEVWPSVRNDMSIYSKLQSNITGLDNHSSVVVDGDTGNRRVWIHGKESGQINCSINE